MKHNPVNKSFIEPDCSKCENTIGIKALAAKYELEHQRFWNLRKAVINEFGYDKYKDLICKE
jgi:hypothetical protein